MHLHSISEEGLGEQPFASGFLDVMKHEQTEARKLTTLLEISQTLAGTHKLKDAMIRVLETLGRHHGVLRGVVMLHDHDTGELRIEASHGLNEGGARSVSYRTGEGIKIGRASCRERV